MGGNMNDIIYKIKWDEWCILAACAKIENMCCFSFEKEKKSQRELVMQLHKMFQQDMIAVIEGRFYPKGEYAEIMNGIRNAEQVVVIEKCTKYCTQQGILYIGFPCVWIRNDQQGSNILQICFVEYESWKKELLEEEFFPVFSSEYEERWRVVKGFPKKEQCNFYLEKRYNKKESVCMAVTEKDGNLVLWRKRGERIERTGYRHALVLEELERLEEDE